MTKTKKPPETEKAADKLICESCGAAFFCGANVGECWCFSVDVTPEKLVELRENFNRCLCQSCLADARESSGGFETSKELFRSGG